MTWHFVRSEDNPADDCTRASPPKDFVPGCRWIVGPSFLLDPKYVPEPFTFHTDKLEDDKVASTVNVGQLHITPSYCHPLAPAISGLIARSKQLAELKREVAQLSRAGLPANENLSTDDLQEAFRIYLMVSQEESFGREFRALLKGTAIPRDSTLRRVGPYICQDEGLLKVDGRLEHDQLPVRTRHSIIIAADNPLTKLIINDRHVKIHHAGVEHTPSRS
jgi:hypothetical protein